MAERQTECKTKDLPKGFRHVSFTSELGLRAVFSLKIVRVIINLLLLLLESKMSRLMGKPTICIGGNKDADQLRGNHEADQRLCFRYSL